ncbi:family 43 glycosylhydrolase [Sphingomonas yunnanensis]|uniref:family 43 glycosylhydrolase n=1 Tax=Sphingomonas yunnanensis TaxID=310400 RepID=UPI001CA6F7EB|nr:family 43 glycosylhydrolase [Sphingomonas yunnanensis]MBY9064918.1 family 43 glycosylhydrolase [Sphingomonas yunnanensis]
MRRSRSLMLALPVLAAATVAADTPALAPGARNPILPGYFADPSIVHAEGEWFVYATVDSWGGDTLALWRSRDLRDWTLSTPDWPTKRAATSPTSNDSRVWAPSVVHAHGRYWMYVSVGSEVWVGSAPHPAGPWRDANDGRPLIPGNYRPGYHMIDAEAFVDDDGQAYLYWGSGLDWVNGHCFAVRLKPDMVSFDGAPVDVTPAHYFEAPFMFKRGGVYFLTYSWGNTTTDSYQVRYAVGTSPLGPFHEPADRPILATDRARGIVSPGHHAVFRAGGEDFILYHRQSLPYAPGGDVRRQVALDRLVVRGDRIEPVTPSNRGVDVPGTATRRARTAIAPAAITASRADPAHAAALAGDDNYATSWRSTGAGTLTLDLGRRRRVARLVLRLGAPTVPTRLAAEASDDGVTWRPIAPVRAVTGSPVTIAVAREVRLLRVTLPEGGEIIEASAAPMPL